MEPSSNEEAVASTAPSSDRIEADDGPVAAALPPGPCIELKSGATVEAVPQIDAAQERDVWWGSYAGRTMLPSLAVCLLLTGVIVWFGFTTGRPMAQPIILGVNGVVWLVQVARWSYRVFGINYRLSSRRLFVDRGFLHPERFEADLREIRAVHIDQDGFEKLVGVGRVRVELGHPAQRILVLKGIKEPQTLVDLLHGAMNAGEPEA
jgi:hypothetical protein